MPGRDIKEPYRIYEPDRELSGQAVFFYRNTVEQEETQNDTGKTDG